MTLIVTTVLTVLLIPPTMAAQQTFLDEPWDVTVVAGDKNKKGLLQWTKDGFGLGVLRSLPGYPRYTMTGDEERGEWNLEISPVTSSDDGVYQCQVSSKDEDPAIRSPEAVLTVMSPPGPPVIQQGEELEISEGEEAELVCVSQGARPAGEIVWKFADSGEEIVSNTKSQTVKIAKTKTFLTTSVLKLRASSADDRKKIICSVSNHLLAKPITADIKLLLKFKPRVVVSVDKKVLSVGESFTAHCEASAFPRAVEYSWHLDSQLVEGEGREKITVSEVSQDLDNKQLECRVRNAVGSSSATVTIHIKYGPVVTGQPRSLTVREGTSAKFSCSGSGNPAPRYRWYRLAGGDREEVGEGRDLVLVGSSLTQGQYICEVRVGETKVFSDPATLSLYTRPVIVAEKTQYGSPGQDIKLSCSVYSGLDNDNSISWDVAGVPVSPDDFKYDVRVTHGLKYVSELVILQADLDDFVSYGCEATNQLGYDYVRIDLRQEGEELDRELWYVIIAVLSVLIILTLLVGCFILGRKREKSNAELIKNANEREKIKENEYVTSFPKNKGPEPDLIPSVNKCRNLPKNLLSPQEDISDEEDHITNYKICPIDDEESHIYAKLTRPLPYMMQRFEQQPLCSNTGSLSSLESDSSLNLSPARSSLDSANSEFRRKNTPQSGLFPSKRPFVIKNLYVKPDNNEQGRTQTDFMVKNSDKINGIEDSEDDDDQYVTLLPAQQNLQV